jgi:hypothetical protein
MAWGAIAAAGIGLLGGVMQGQQQRSAADAQNAAQKKQIKDQYKRDLKQWKLNNAQSQVEYAWALANTEASRYQERVNKADYEAQQSRIIDAALTNLALNTQALQDQYIVSERLRALEASSDLSQGLANQALELDSNLAGLNYQEAVLASEFITTTEDLNNREVIDQAKINTTAAARKAEIDNQAAASNAAALEAVANYMNSIKLKGLEADGLIAQKQNQGKAIQEQIVIAEQLDTLKRDALYITALVEGADRKASVVARSGGSNSARRAALDSMQAFGRSYALLKAEQADRRRAAVNYNATLTGESSAELAQIAMAITGQRDRIQSTKDIQGLKNQGFALAEAQADATKALSTADLAFDTGLGRATAQATNQLGMIQINQQRADANNAYTLNTNTLLSDFNDLTVPTFDLAKRQGDRDFNTLVSNTINTLKGASTPYRDAIIFDPLLPIAGLKPEKAAFTPVAKQGWGSILAGSFVQAAQGAMSMSYTKADGSLGFR